MPKVKSSQSKKEGRVRQHNPLSEDIADTGVFRAKSDKQKSRHDEQQDHYINPKASRKILQIGRELAEEDREPVEDSAPKSAFTLESRHEDIAGSDHDRTDDDDDSWGDEDEIVEEVEVDPGDLHTFNRFLPSTDELSLQGESTPTNLADLILEKINAHEASQARAEAARSKDPGDSEELPAKVVEAYSRVGILLSRYKSGKLPKLFKVLPTLPNWEEILAITRPESWTPNACYEATRIFASGKPGMTQTFLEQVILDRVREDIHEHKKLNVHLYKALKKSLYKPAGFFKGFLFPLVGSGTCTLREAHIVSSVLTRVSIPVLHSAAALLRLCDIAAEQASMSTEGGGATNIFIRVLLDKKYALPYKVIDALVFHFLRFKGAAAPMTATGGGDDATGPGLEMELPVAGRLPVLWHQSLLAFAQRYRNDITEDQREALLDLLLVKGHAAIGPEIRRELLEGRGRGMPLEPAAAALDGGDDTMMVDPEPRTARRAVTFQDHA